jgi:hypothetical protein
MQAYLKKSHVIQVLFVLFFSVLVLSATTHVFAQGTDSIVKCGNGPEASSACKLNKEEFGGAVKGFLSLIITIGLPVLFILMAYRFVMAWFLLVQGNTNAYKDAIQKATSAVYGFMIVVVLIGGGLYAVLIFLGVDPKILEILKFFTFSDLFQHAYAYDQPGFLPRFVKADSLYNFILDALRLVMKFFIYPSLIVIWVWTGFSFVLAQGAPEALAKAKKWLMWAFITTLAIMVLQGFLIALQNSVNKILGTQPTIGQACKTQDGRNGQIGSDNTCYAGGTR